jgi:hypothetical protein
LSINHLTEAKFWYGFELQRLRIEEEQRQHNSKIESAHETAGYFQEEIDLQYWKYSHLPAHLAEVSKPFCKLAVTIYRTLPLCSERLKALDALMAAKDSAVRAKLWKRLE